MTFRSRSNKKASRNGLLESVVLFLKSLEPPGLFALHTAVLAPPTAQRGFADLKSLQDFANALAGCQHGVRIAKLFDDLFG